MLSTTLSLSLSLTHAHAGGIGGFVLSIFHKLETSSKTKRLRECCPLLRREANAVCCEERESEGEREKERRRESYSLMVDINFRTEVT